MLITNRARKASAILSRKKKEDYIITMHIRYIFEMYFHLLQQNNRFHGAHVYLLIF